jgi:phasin family protein
MTKNAKSIFDFDVTKMMPGFTHLPGVDMEAFVDGQRKTVAAFGAANWAAFEGAQKIFWCQAEMVQESLSGIVPGFSELATAATPAAAATQACLCKGVYEKVASDGRELVDLMTKSHRATTAPIQKRIVESLEEVKVQADKLGT